jgi:hypothetical protein
MSKSDRVSLTNEKKPGPDETKLFHLRPSAFICGSKKERSPFLPSPSTFICGSKKRGFPLHQTFI